MTADELAAKIEILELSAEYGRAADADDMVAWAGCFTEGGIFASELGTFVLPDDRDRFGVIMEQAKQQLRNTRHVITNVVSQVDGDRASARSCFVLFSIQDGAAPVSVSSGTYSDTLRRTDKGWRIEHRRALADGVVASESLDGAAR